MNDTVIQAVVWVAAGGLLMLYLKRRRKRRTDGSDHVQPRGH